MLKSMSTKPATKPDDPAQSKRFLEMASELDAEGSAKTLERALRKVAAKRTPPPKKRGKR